MTASTLNKYSREFLQTFAQRYPHFSEAVASQQVAHGPDGYAVVTISSPCNASGELLLITENNEITIGFAKCYHCHCSSPEEAFDFLDQLFEESLCVAAYYNGEKALGGCCFSSGEDVQSQGFENADRILVRSWMGTHNLDWKEAS